MNAEVLMKLKTTGLFLIATLMFVFGMAEQSTAQDRSDDLDRPVRVLISGISGQLATEVTGGDFNQKIDFNYPSKQLSDFDLMVIFTDHFFEALDEEIVRALGFVESDFQSNDEDNFLTVLTAEFEGDETPFPILVINRRHFYARDRTCHVPLLRDLILKADWPGVLDRERDYKLASDCGNSS
ncbi:MULTISPECIES: hypothetical protein [unclassified Ruegeria]|uniref:hypothetical protein n=2 Tax=unclassified Ruegeria TaxID=2625375 RepID=UPI0014887BA8|nr:MULTISPECIES: hypothetical protein [unclassified Ruegeria]